jgi:hypothetical protein
VPGGDQNNCDGNSCCPIYPREKGHIKQRVGDERILGSKHQMCAAFYHVPQWYYKDIKRFRTHFCLDQDKCIIAKEAKNSIKNAKEFAEKPRITVQEPAEDATKFAKTATKSAKGWYAQPKTVVAVVKFEDGNGKILYEARYTNCGKEQKHAEDFFKEDIEKENGVLAEIVEANTNGTITMYLTLQPCNKSTSIKGTQKTKPNQSCCDILRKIYNKTLRKDGRNINLCVKATHTNRLSPSNEEYGDDEDDEDKILQKNAVDGIKQLMQDGVNVMEMTQKDWDYLFAMTKDDVNRKDLDKDVRNTFKKIRDETRSGQMNLVSGELPRLFIPPTKDLQQSLCNTLNLPLKCEHEPCSNKNLGRPTKIHKIKGDGNCLFRALSYAITGSQGYHKEVRENVINHMKNIETLLLPHMKNKPLNSYLDSSRMANTDSWGTDVEIIAASSLLSTDIYVDTKVGKGDIFKWQTFSESMQNGSEPNNTCAIYLQNTNGDHYDIVLDV